MSEGLIEWFLKVSGQYVTACLSYSCWKVGGELRKELEDDRGG